MTLQRHLHADALVHSNGAQGSCGSTEVSVKLSQLRDELKNGSEGLADEEVEAERHKVVCHDDKGGFIRIAGHCTYSGTGGRSGGRAEECEARTSGGASASLSHLSFRWS